MGKGDRKLGLCGKLEPKTTTKIDRKAEQDTDSIMAVKEGKAKLPKTEKIPTQWGPTGWGNNHERYNDWHYHNWCVSNECGKFAMPPTHKGSFARGGNPNPIGRTPWTDPGGKAYEEDERSVAGKYAFIK